MVAFVGAGLVGVGQVKGERVSVKNLVEPREPEDSEEKEAKIMRLLILDWGELAAESG